MSGIKNGGVLSEKRKQWIAYVYRPQRTITPPRIRFVFDTLAEILARKLVI